MEMFGTLVITTNVWTPTSEASNKELRRKTVRLHAYHGTLDEVKACYKVWREANPGLAKEAAAVFEVRESIHESDLD